MMEHRSVILYIAASLDGYIATEEESLDWLFSVQGEGDNGYTSFFDTVDTVLMGRKTYDWIMRTEQGRFPYPGRECYVFSRSRTGSDGFVTYVGGDVAAFTAALKHREGKKIWMIGGGEALLDVLRAGLIDEIVVNIAPRLLGRGIPLFPKGDYGCDLSLIGIKQYGQFAELHYSISSK
jgi:dihydrofolate reductase